MVLILQYHVLNLNFLYLYVLDNFNQINNFLLHFYILLILFILIIKKIMKIFLVYLLPNFILYINYTIFIILHSDIDFYPNFIPALVNIY